MHLSGIQILSTVFIKPVNVFVEDKSNVPQLLKIFFASCIKKDLKFLFCLKVIELEFSPVLYTNCCVANIFFKKKFFL